MFYRTEIPRNYPEILSRNFSSLRMIRTKSDLEEMVFLTIVQRLPEVLMINEFINADLCQTYDSASGIALQGPFSFVSSECP